MPGSRPGCPAFPLSSSRGPAEWTLRGWANLGVCKLPSSVPPDSAAAPGPPSCSASRLAARPLSLVKSEAGLLTPSALSLGPGPSLEPYPGVFPPPALFSRIWNENGSWGRGLNEGWRCSFLGSHRTPHGFSKPNIQLPQDGPGRCPGGSSGSHFTPLSCSHPTHSSGCFSGRGG